MLNFLNQKTDFYNLFLNYAFVVSFGTRFHQFPIQLYYYYLYLCHLKFNPAVAVIKMKKHHFVLIIFYLNCKH